MIQPGLTAGIADDQAWYALRHWPAHTQHLPAGGRLRWRGLEAEPIVRSLLWDKVGRAVRAILAPAAFDALERELLHRRNDSRDGEWDRINRELRAAIPVDLRKSNGRIRSDPTQSGASPRGSRPAGPRSVYVGVPSRITLPYVRALAADPRFRVSAPPVEEPGFEGVTRHAWPKGVPEPDAGFVAALAAAVLDGLAHQGLRLLEPDADELRAELWREDRRIARIALELDAVKPDALLLHADNHPPFVQYALAARARRIPVFLVQHGLDCERYFLDDAFATHLLVWSPNRATRYLRDSRPRPHHVRVVGHPTGRMPDHLLPPTPGEPGHVLWVTRPHDTHKCLSPSRSPGEGVVILDVLLRSLLGEPRARLTIKPHPADASWLYARRLAAEPAEVGARVVISDEALADLLPRAAVVVTEDSTAGLDALLAGRPLVQAHLCPTPPVVPFAECRAALPGFTPEQLGVSMNEALALSLRGAPAWVGGERCFIPRFAGPTDGKGVERAVEHIARVLGARGAITHAGSEQA